MKKYKWLILVLLIIPCFFMCGCIEFSEDVYVTGITKGQTVGNETTYIVNYSDGSTTNFSVQNGEDGADLTLEVIQDYCTEQGITLEEYFSSLDIEFNVIQLASNKALKSAVVVYTESPYSNNKDYLSLSAGAGVIYKMEQDYSYIITNYHVVKSTTTISGIASNIVLYQYGTSNQIVGVNPYISVGKYEYYSDYTYGTDAIIAEYIGGAEEFDIAVLKVGTTSLKNVNDDACAVAIADGYSIAETAIAIGNPNGDGVSVTSGIISVASEEINFEDGFPNYRVMRIDAAVNGGNSGGGLFNSKGELIGIVNAKIEDSTIDNIAYALPYDNITKVADNLIYYYKQNNSISTVKKLYLNISYATENSHAEYDSANNTTKIYDQAVVKTANESGVGYMLGLREGCVIESITINNATHAIERAYQIPDLLLTIRAGDKVKINCSNAGFIPNEVTILESYLLTYTEINS